MKSIRTKLMVMFLVIISVPLIALGAITYLNASGALQSIIEDTTLTTAQEVSQIINQELTSIQRVLQVAKADDNLVGLVSGRSSDTRDVFNYIQQIKVENQDIFEDVILVNSSYTAFMTSNSESVSIDVSDRDYMVDVMANQVAISDVLTSKESGESVIVIAVPIVENDIVTGAIMGTVLFSNIETIIHEIEVGSEGYGYLINSEGTVVVHDNQSYVDDGYNLLSQNNAELESVVNKMVDKETGLGFYTFDGTYKMVAYAPIAHWSLGITANYDDYMAPAIKIRAVTLILTLSSIAIALLIAFVFSTSMVRPIKKLQALMKQAGQGDLTVRCQTKSKDEVGALAKSFNEMMAEQSNIVGQVRQGSVELVSMAQDLAASSEELTATSEESRARSEQVAEESVKQSEATLAVSQALVELSSLVNLAKGKADGAGKASDNTKEIALKGREKIKGVVHAMSQISDKTNSASNTIQDVNTISRRISEITKAISDVADQTNLLALNAAIEASRAGEHGRGFMVVAEEIRKLAETTNKESEEIRVLTTDMVKNIHSAVGSVEASQNAVKEGVEIVTETDTFFLEIVDAVEKTGSDIVDISDITETEVSTSDHIIALIDAVSSSAEENSLSVGMISNNIIEQSDALESISAASEETNAMAETLNSLVDRFIVDKEDYNESNVPGYGRPAFSED